MYDLNRPLIAKDWKLTLVVCIAFPIVFFCGNAFKSSFAGYMDVIVQEHQEADTMSEETFRNIKTVASLGAEKKMEGRFDRIVGVERGLDG